MQSYEPAPVPHRWRYVDTLLVFLAGVAASLVASVIALAVSGVDLVAGEDLPTEWVFWFVFPAQLVGSYVVLRWVSRSRGTGNLEQDFGFELLPKDAVWALAGGVLLVATALITLTLQQLLGVGEENAQDLVNLVAEEGAGVTAFAMVAGIAVFGPIIEEITYRGLLFNTAVERGSVQAAIPITAAVFSLVHLVGLDPGEAEGIGEVALTFIPPLVALFFVGLVLAIVRSRTDSLSAPIFLHGGFNLIQVLLLLFLPDVAS